MKRNEKRYHEVIGNKVASVYIQEFYLPKAQTFDDGTNTITTSYYENIGVCVSNSRRTNNDWWNGDKSGNRLYNKSTGTASTFMEIVDTLTVHVLEFCIKYGYYCCVFTPTDSHRRKVYMSVLKHVCKKCNLTYRYVLCDDDEIMVWIE